MPLCFLENLMGLDHLSITNKIHYIKTQKEYLTNTINYLLKYLPPIFKLKVNLTHICYGDFNSSLYCERFSESSFVNGTYTALYDLGTNHNTFNPINQNFPLSYSSGYYLILYSFDKLNLKISDKGHQQNVKKPAKATRMPANNGIRSTNIYRGSFDLSQSIINVLQKHFHIVFENDSSNHARVPKRAGASAHVIPSNAGGLVPIHLLKYYSLVIVSVLKKAPYTSIGKFPFDEFDSNELQEIFRYSDKNLILKVLEKMKNSEFFDVISKISSSNFIPLLQKLDYDDCKRILYLRNNGTEKYIHNCLK